MSSELARVVLRFPVESGFLEVRSTGPMTVEYIDDLIEFLAVARKAIEKRTPIADERTPTSNPGGTTP